MSFFDSEVVRAEMAEIQELQEDIYESVFKFPSMSDEDKLEHVSKLERLISKQQIMFTRLSLSDDPDAIKMKEQITDSARMMGLPPTSDMNTVFNNMNRILDIMKKQIDKGI